LIEMETSTCAASHRNEFFLDTYLGVPYSAV
jgi:hypothetical protein